MRAVRVDDRKDIVERLLFCFFVKRKGQVSGDEGSDGGCVFGLGRYKSVRRCGWFVVVVVSGGWVVVVRESRVRGREVVVRWG